MVFFNYSTMQMAAKIVYYGPGLCGKTTNLQYVYGHTNNDSRGEMVSLETETDRTLFFDLLPIDVGSIAGFNTRIQLYTVPGQVFYNTTRKLVLKGVDGVVFVADSQRPMLQANIESLANLEENLAEIGLSVHDIPLVLQYNKRDLKEICTVEELNQALNKNGYPYYEASALNGDGVFETLKGISKLTLLSLKKRLSKAPPSAETGQQAERPPAAPTPPLQGPTPDPSPAVGGGTNGPHPTPPRPSPPPESTHPAPPSPPPPEVPPEISARPPATPESAPAATTPSGQRKQVDILAELEKIRRQALGGTADGERRSSNGRGEINREIQLRVTRQDFMRARRFSVSLQVEDEESQVVDAFREEVEIHNIDSLEKVLLRLNIALNPEE